MPYLCPAPLTSRQTRNVAYNLKFAPLRVEPVYVCRVCHRVRGLVILIIIDETAEPKLSRLADRELRREASPLRVCY